MGLFRFFKKKKLKNVSKDSLNTNIQKKEIYDNKNLELKDINKNKNTGKNKTVTSKSQRLFTPNIIDNLALNEVFVFGSNLKGHHNGGAAKIALDKFGAKYEQGVGMQGQSYAIPTMQGGVETIIPYVNDFIDYAKEHRNIYFLVTRIGCGIAGFKNEQIAPLFEKALPLSNVILPKSFVNIIKKNQVLKISKIEEYGQVRAIADIVKTLNNQNRYDSLSLLLHDLDNIIKKYEKRGTLTFDTLSLIKSILFQNENSLFSNYNFDVNLFGELLENKEYINDEIENIFKLQTNAKLLRIVKILNKKKIYTSSSEIINDLDKILNSHLFDLNYHEPIYFLKQGLLNSWNEIAINGKLDNFLMEKVIFQDHESKVKKLGLGKVIEIDYKQGGCHSNVYSPKKVGTAPIYVKMENDEYAKSCGQGKGPYGDPNIFEEQLLRLLKGC